MAPRRALTLRILILISFPEGPTMALPGTTLPYYPGTPLYLPPHVYIPVHESAVQDLVMGLSIIG